MGLINSPEPECLPLSVSRRQPGSRVRTSGRRELRPVQRAPTTSMRDRMTTPAITAPIDRTLLDVSSTIDEYLNRQDWRVNANANQGYSLGGLILNSAGKMIANYWLSHVYPLEIGQAHRDGDLHIHDLDMLSGYCAGWSLRTLLNEGLNGIPGQIDSAPPRHMSSAVGQIVNFLGTLQNEWAGAQAFSSFDTYMAPYVRKDQLDYPQVRQHIQELIHNLNVPSRWGTQTPFTNLTFDWVCPEDRKSTRLNSSHVRISYAVFCLKKKKD